MSNRAESLVSGTEDGIQFRVFLSPPNLVAETDKDGDVRTKSWHWAYEPIFGIDAMDYAAAESALDDLILSYQQKGKEI